MFVLQRESEREIYIERASERNRERVSERECLCVRGRESKRVVMLNRGRCIDLAGMWSTGRGVAAPPPFILLLLILPPPLNTQSEC